MRKLGNLLSVLGYVAFLSTGVWGAILVFPPVYHWLNGSIGWLAIPVLVFLSAVIILLAPWYFAFAMGWWQPVIVAYGGAALSVLLATAGKALGAAAD